MSFLVRSFVAVAFTATLGSAGCGESNPQAGPEASASGSGAKPTLPLGALQPAKRIDPVVMKTYRAESCYFGTLALRHARAAYLANLAGGEPGPGKIPEFAVEELGDAAASAPVPAAPAGSGAPAGSAKAAAPAKTAAVAADKPAPKTASSAAPKGSAKAAVAAAPPGASAGAPDRAELAKLRMRQLPYERFSRSCNVAATLKEPASADLDPAMKEYSEFVLPLTKKLAEASSYYQKEEYKADDFAKGKEYHKDIVAGFDKLDAAQQKLRAALDKFESQSPIDASAYVDGQKASGVVLAEARALILKLDAGEDAKDALTKLEAANEALKKLATEGDKEKKDPWATIVPPSVTQLIDLAKTLTELDPKKVPPAKVVSAINLYTRVLEASHRALTKSLMSDAAGRSIGNERRIRPKLPMGHPE